MTKPTALAGGVLQVIDRCAGSLYPVNVEASMQLLSARVAMEELIGAARKYRAAVDLMDDAMQDGVNVQGAVSGLFGATDNLDAALTACTGATHD